MSIKQWNLVLVLGLLAALSGGGYVLYQNHLTQEALRLVQIEEERLAAEKAEADRVLAEKIAGLTQEFEDFLNGFLASVSAEVREYRKTRKVLVSLTQPANLRTTEYIEENYKMGEATVMSLRLQMDKVMGLFETAEEQFQVQLAKWPEGRGTKISKSWRVMKDEQVNLYLGYFASEQDLLSAMQLLLDFYYEKRDVLVVDVLRNEIQFIDQVDAQRHGELQANVDALKAMQSKLLD